MNYLIVSVFAIILTLAQMGAEAFPEVSLCPEGQVYNTTSLLCQLVG